jgi:hypothetical protein
METDNTKSGLTTSPLGAVREKCLECMDNSPKRVKECEVFDCPIHHLRFKKNPFRKQRVLSDEERKERSERMKKIRRDRNG